MADTDLQKRMQQRTVPPARGRQLVFPLVRDGKRVVRNGAATNDLVRSAYVEGNEHVFPRILDLYVKPASVVADVTYGKGVFWRNVEPEPGRYDLRATSVSCTYRVQRLAQRCRGRRQGRNSGTYGRGAERHIQAYETADGHESHRGTICLDRR